MNNKDFIDLIDEEIEDIRIRHDWGDEVPREEVISRLEDIKGSVREIERTDGKHSGCPEGSCARFVKSYTCASSGLVYPT